MKPLHGKTTKEFPYAFRGSFIAANNLSGFNCFYLNRKQLKYVPLR